jgi:hypothetical protein
LGKVAVSFDQESDDSGGFRDTHAEIGCTGAFKFSLRSVSQFALLTV